MSRHLRTVRYQLTDAHARLTSAIEQLRDALRSLEDAQPGYPTSTLGEGGGSRDDAGHPGGLDKFLFQQDPAAHDLRNMLVDAKSLHTASIRLLDIAMRWAAETGVEGNRKPNRASSGGGDCVACDRFVSNSRTDRLKAGLCPACSVSWYSDPLTDRNEWILKRRRRLAVDRVDRAESA